ncbi:YkoF family thiamine/hydroxymethylpyrimidine-binding protein, partial [Lactococcus lactis]
MSSDASHTVKQAIQTLNKAGLPVWSKTTSVGTTYRGRQENVINVVQTLCQLAHKENTETAFELTFSKGCRGDKDT